VTDGKDFDSIELMETTQATLDHLIWENPILHEKVEHMLTRPVGRPPRKPIIRYHSFRYQAASWKIARRIVAKIEWHAGEAFSTSQLRSHESSMEIQQCGEVL